MMIANVRATDEASAHALFVKLNEIINALNDATAAVEELRVHLEKMGKRIDQLER